MTDKNGGATPNERIFVTEHHEREVRKHWDYLTHKYANAAFRGDTSQEVANVTNDAINLARGFLRYGYQAPRSEIAVPEEREAIIEWIECEEFYNLMQSYRYAPGADQSVVMAAYRAVKGFIADEILEDRRERTSLSATATHPIAAGDLATQRALAERGPSFVNMRIAYKGFSYGMGSEDGISSLRRAIEKNGDY